MNRRGVKQVPEVDGLTAIICQDSRGAVIRKVTLSASVPDEWVAWEVRKAEQWLDRYDPVLRLVASGLAEPKA